MSKTESRNIFDILQQITPAVLRPSMKSLVLKLIRRHNRRKYIKKGKNVEIGSAFRYDRLPPFSSTIDDGSIVEDNNVWSVLLGDIDVGKNCWFGLNNVLMGPLEIGDNFSSGPYVMILGPRHPVLELDYEREQKTIIGSNVTIASGSIILYGVHIGDGAVILAGSVVNKDVPEGATFAGNPARNVSAMTKELWENRRLESCKEQG